MNAGPSVRETVQSAYVQRGSMTMTMTPFLEEPPVLLKREQRRRDPSNGVIHQGSPSGKGMAGLETQMDARREMPGSWAGGSARRSDDHPLAGLSIPYAI